MDATASERWPRLMAEHRARQAVLATTASRRPLTPATRGSLWWLATVTACLSAWMAVRGSREVDLSPTEGLADPVGLAWGAIYGGTLLLLLGFTDGIVIGLGRSLRPFPRTLVFAAAVVLTACVLALLVLLQVSANRLSYV